MTKVLILNTKNRGATEMSAILFEKYFERETGIKVKYADLKRNDYGKPLPIGGWHFNLSHSGQYWVMALSDNREVGIDIEMRRDLRPRIARRILAAGEEALEGDLLRTWVLKEAYAKKVGEGLLLGFRSFTSGDIFERYVVTDYSTSRYYCYLVY